MCSERTLHLERRIFIDTELTHDFRPRRIRCSSQTETITPAIHLAMQRFKAARLAVVNQIELPHIPCDNPDFQRQTQARGISLRRQILLENVHPYMLRCQQFDLDQSTP